MKERLTAYETHCLIKKDLPWCHTYWELNEEAHQITIEEYLHQQWKEQENQLKKEAPELYKALSKNIERNKK
jgi:hypothetical protein